VDTNDDYINELVELFQAMPGF
jgi:hypothetical protein